ncbi:MAG: hypothetical protein V7634_3168 [Bradyrhizobium sp.]|jgi:uncharacterized protein (DUF924 family)
MAGNRWDGAGSEGREAFELASHAGEELCCHTAAQPVDPADVISFWQEAGTAMWFAEDPNFDRRFRERFLSAYDAARRGELDDWPATPNGALALLILLDQFPRNAFRGTARIHESDAQARDVAERAIAADFPGQICPKLRAFIYMPLHHSEQLADQERAVALMRELGDEAARAAEHHCEIIRRFGRFPHRNAILGRTTTAEEQEYLDQGGFAGGSLIEPKSTL